MNLPFLQNSHYLIKIINTKYSYHPYYFHNYHYSLQYFHDLISNLCLNFNYSKFLFFYPLSEAIVLKYFKLQKIFGYFMKNLLLTGFMIYNFFQQVFFF